MAKLREQLNPVECKMLAQIMWHDRNPRKRRGIPKPTKNVERQAVALLIKKHLAYERKGMILANWGNVPRSEKKQFRSLRTGKIL